MRSCLVLIALVLIAGFLFKSCVSENPLKSVFEDAKMKAPIDLDYERRPWFLGIGFREYLKFVNKSSGGVRILSGQVVRAGGRTEKIDGMPQILKPFEATEIKLMDGIANFVIETGDEIQINCEGYPIPSVLGFIK